MSEYLDRPARAMRPTKKHRPAVWENMLGTLYAQNDAGDVCYFDYDWDAAFEYAGYAENRDPRAYGFTGERAMYRYHNGSVHNTSPRKGQRVLWLKPSPDVDYCEHCGFGEAAQHIERTGDDEFTGITMGVCKKCAKYLLSLGVWI